MSRGYYRKGLRRGPRGGISSKNTSADWARYYKKYGHSPNYKKKISKELTPPDPRDVEEVEVYNFLKEQKERESHYEAFGYDPNDPDADAYIELEMEEGMDDGP